MKPGDNPNWFANNPLARLNNEKDQSAFIKTRLADADSLLIPLWRGDPLMADGSAAFLSASALAEFPKKSLVVFLGLKNGRAHFGVDASPSAQTPDAATFSEIGEYAPLRMAASTLTRDDLAIIGQARWLFEWHRKHTFCANCGHETSAQLGGAKRICPACEEVHFPRTNPVAIVLATHDDACLMGRGPQFPPGFLSALAGFVEAAETPEECAKRELFEEVGVTLTDVRYQFSQPWPFTNSLMMGFLADTTDREINLDKDEIEEARWIDKTDIIAVLNGKERDFGIPPKFTIARQLVERWASA